MVWCGANSPGRSERADAGGRAESFGSAFKAFKAFKAGYCPEETVQLLASMGALIPVCLAEFAAIKGIALLAFGLIAYLYWTGLKEKLAQRRERQWLENKRRELKAKVVNKAEPPRSP